MEPLHAHYAILDRRLDSLESAIRLRDWDAVEFAFDQVSRASGKLGALSILREANPSPGGREPSVPRGE